MTPAEIARAMAAYIRAHGFSPRLCDPDGCGCFIHAKNMVGITHWGSYALSRRIDKAIAEVVGVSAALGEGELREAGWERGYADDAAAACEIAADLLEP